MSEKSSSSSSSTEQINTNNSQSSNQVQTSESTINILCVLLIYGFVFQIDQVEEGIEEIDVAQADQSDR